MNTLTHNCPFCQHEMSVENFTDFNHIVFTCRNGECRAYGVTLSPAGWDALTPEILETYPRQYAPETTEKVDRPDDDVLVFTTEKMGAKTFLVVTGVTVDQCHSIYDQSDIARFVAMYEGRGYRVQMAVAS